MDRRGSIAMPNQRAGVYCATAWSGKTLILCQFGNDKVVIGIEPFGHFARLTGKAAGLFTASQYKASVQVGDFVISAYGFNTFWNGSQGNAGI